MTVNGFLPHILQPTRITDSTMTLIDNIYTNNFSDDIFGGNLLMEIADHLAQFISVEKDTGNKVQPNNYYKETTQNGIIKTFWMIYQSKNDKMI